ncbi:hypothetical protein EVAR_64689_1 [Eumeta japonica]|uniref:Uncharacterized protein n=1 Tax=Eumeta variegata TaxID=151549 RepID=A0A4C1ZLU3_EUMVA|nr:hypothetical protein EVAR_64689_1 [Eumeta japonica]
MGYYLRSDEPCSVIVSHNTIETLCLRSRLTFVYVPVPRSPHILFQIMCHYFWVTCDGISDAVFALDLVVQLRTGYLEQGLMGTPCYRANILASGIKCVKSYATAPGLCESVERCASETTHKLWRLPYAPPQVPSQNLVTLMV